MVVGPGLIVMVADNDAGAVSTYVQAGAQYGTTLLWVLLLLWPTITRGERLTQKIFGAVRLDNAGFIYLHQEDYFQWETYLAFLEQVVVPAFYCRFSVVRDPGFSKPFPPGFPFCTGVRFMSPNRRKADACCL